MAWKPSLPPVELARLYALEAIFQEALPDLNTALGSNPDTSYLLQQFAPLDPAVCIDIGDLEIMPPIAQGFIQIRLEAGDYHGGLNFTSAISYLSGGNEDVYSTACYGYLHDQAFRNTAKQLQARQRETALQILTGWMRARVLNYGGILTDGTQADRTKITLVSQERFPDGVTTPGGLQATDYLVDCCVKQGHVGYFKRGYNDQMLYGVQLNHEGKIRG